MINRILIFLIRYLRPFLGPADCRFYETCTPYAIRQLKDKPPYKAVCCIAKRLMNCAPFGIYGFLLILFLLLAYLCCFSIK